MTTLAPTATAAALKPEVVGKALYIELTPILNEEGKPISKRIWGGSSSIRQILVFPKGTTPEGRDVPARVYSRIVSSHYPRSQWDSDYINYKPSKAELKELLAKNPDSYYVEWNISRSELDEMPDEVRGQLRLNFLEEWVRDKVTEVYREWDEDLRTYTNTTAVTWEPSLIRAIEVTDKDYSDLEAYKTPQAVVRRTIKARVDAGFPEKLV